MKLLREPLLHFLLIGAVIYLAYGAFNEPVPDEQDKTLVVDAGEIEWLVTGWYKRWKRPPTQQELDGLIQQYIRETILYREALAMGLDRDDAVVRRRLAQKLAFLAEDLATMASPPEDELLTYFEQNKDRYRAPTLYSFTQVYVNPDKRGDATLDDARAIKAALISESDGLDRAGERGDAVALQAHYPEISQANLRKYFGNDFAESLSGLSPQQWHGPVLSGYGVHLVYIHNIEEPAAPVFDEVRTRVQQDWEEVRRKAVNEQFYAGLRERYTIFIDGIEAGSQQ